MLIFLFTFRFFVEGKISTNQIKLSLKGKINATWENIGDWYIIVWILSSTGIICYFVIPFFCSCAEDTGQVVLLKFLKLVWQISQIRPCHALFAQYFCIFKGGVVTLMTLLLFF